jgi:hypothetical protein
MTVDIHLRIVGALLLILAALNLLLPRWFQWKVELTRLSLLTRQVFVVHACFIVLVLVLTGLLSLVYADALLEHSQLAQAVLAGLAIFWAARLVVQWFVYDRRLWLGHKFNTAMHAAFTCLWTYLTAVYSWALWSQFS